MKVKAIHIVLVVILTLIVVLLSTSSSIVPYSKDTLFSHMYKYEGMSSISADVQENHKKEEQPPSVFQKITGMLSGNQENANASEPGKKMVEGFALQPSPLDSSEAIDRYSKVSASPSCFGKSSGYSNSMGPLCISGEDLKLLSTRGGNVTGTDSVIGN